MKQISRIFAPFFRAVDGQQPPMFRAPIVSSSSADSIAEMKAADLRRELAKPVEQAPPHEERQESDYWALWRTVRTHTASTIPPKLFDAAVPDHVALATSVVGDYDALREAPGPFSDCLYRPVSSLPYPKAVIRQCCEFLIRIADSAPFPDGNRDELVKERDTLGLALFSLDYFIDAPATDLPREKEANLAYVKKLLAANVADAESPHTGDRIVRTRFGDSDEVDQVLGVADNNEWTVLTRLGAAMQVVRGVNANVWEEVSVIAPARAPWLTLTPPFGEPGLR